MIIEIVCTSSGIQSHHRFACGCLCAHSCRDGWVGGVSPRRHTTIHIYLTATTGSPVAIHPWYTCIIIICKFLNKKLSGKKKIIWLLSEGSCKCYIQTDNCSHIYSTFSPLFCVASSFVCAPRMKKIHDDAFGPLLSIRIHLPRKTPSHSWFNLA